MPDNLDIITTQEANTTELLVPETMDEQKIKLSELLSMGKGTNEIAETLGRSPAWVRSHRKDTEVVTMVRELQAEALQAAKFCIQTSTVKAAQKIDELISSPMPNIALAASINTLDRVGLKAAEKKEEHIAVTFAHLSKDEIKANIEERLRALRGED